MSKVYSADVCRAPGGCEWFGGGWCEAWRATAEGFESREVTALHFESI